MQRAFILDSTTYLLMRDQDSNTCRVSIVERRVEHRGSTNDRAIPKEGPNRTEGLLRGRTEVGAVVGAKRLLFLQGIKRFGEPDAATIAAIEAIKDSLSARSPRRSNREPGNPELERTVGHALILLGQFDATSAISRDGSAAS